MFHLKQKYASIFTSYMGEGKQVDSDTWNFRCPYCGDSKKDPSKARGYIYKHSNELLYKCHNCGESTTFLNLLKTHNPHLLSEYRKENFRHRNHPAQKKEEKIKKEREPIKKFSKTEESSLLEKAGIHPARPYNEATNYLEKRCIPKEQWDRIFFTKKYRNSELQIKGESTSNIYYDSEAIVFKLHDLNGNLTGLQFRLLDENANLRYKKIKITKSNKQLLFGADVVREPKYIVEGPFDSFFLPDSIAVCSSDLQSVLSKEATYVLDCDNRNREIIKKYRKLINLGCNVTILPEKYSGKDLNDLAMAGMSQENIKELVDMNTYTGLRAVARLSDWAKT